MLKIMFDSKYILHDNIDEMINSIFPNIKYEKHKILKNDLKIIEIHLFLNKFNSAQLEAISSKKDTSYLGFKYAENFEKIKEILMDNYDDFPVGPYGQIMNIINGF